MAISLFVRSLPLLTALGACFSATACGAPADSEGSTVASREQALSSKCQPSVPSTLAVPDGHKLAFSLDAVGVQIYSCNATAGGYAWTFVAPEADLLDPGGDLAGSHYAGPTWEGDDGSKVKAAKVSGYTDDPTSIPWLLLQAVSHEGDGRMSKVSYIQRLDTVGGLAPASACDASHVGEIERVDYAATYYFFEPSQRGMTSSTCE